VDDADQEKQNTNDYEALDPHQRKYYEDSPDSDQGFVERARDTAGDVIVRGEGHGEELDERQGTGPGTTDYLTSNYSVDQGEPPSEGDVYDVSRHPPE